MDPTINLCLVPSQKPIYPNGFKLVKIPTLNVNIKIVSSKASPPPIYVDDKKYSLLNTIKNKYATIDRRQFTYAREQANPFEYLGNSVFGSRAAVKLANIDAIYNLTQHIGGFIDFKTPGRFVFADLAGGPGSFTQYIQWRRPDSVGFGITLKTAVGEGEELDWSYKIIDAERFRPYYGADNTGNLYTNYQGFVDFVKSSNDSDLYLVTADGGFNVEESGDYERQEFVSSRLVLVECLTAILLLNQGGSFVCKVFDTVTKISADTIYMMACCFDELIMFKPVSSRPANSERYLICRGRKSSMEIQTYIQVLKTVASSYTDDQMVEGFVDKLPDNFKKWLTETNDKSMDRQIEYGKRILDINQGKEIDIPLYDTHKCFQYWKIPDNPQSKYTKIKIMQ